MTKICSECGEEKELSEFYKNKTRVDGYEYICGECKRSKAKKYREDNREYVNKVGREWRAGNPEKVKAQRLRDKPAKRKYNMEHKEIRRADRMKHYNKNKHGINIELNKRRKEDVYFKLKQVVSSRISFSLKGYPKIETHFELLGCSIEDFKVYIENQFEDWMSWDNYGSETWHIDHIKPISLFDLTDLKQQKECFHFSNTQPLSAFNNRSKKNTFIG